MIARSAGMGEFVVAPAGLGERPICEAGFAGARVEDVSQNPARNSA
jgi:hypothetical protein